MANDLKMRAFVMKSIREIGFMEKTVPEPGPNEAVVKTTTALICTSDAHTVAGAIGPRENLTLGHEAVGVIHKLGVAVHGYHEGQRVVAGAITPCYHCDNCLRGFTSQCTEMLGGWKFANKRDGVFAEYFLVNAAEANLAPIPNELSDEQAVYCCDMLSTGIAGAENADIPTGGAVAVFAQGPVGLMATAGSRLHGAGLVIAVESEPKRMELAKFYGADIVIDFHEGDPVHKIRDIVGRPGVDSAIEALGSQLTFTGCIRVTKPGGTISNIGYHGEGDFVMIPRMAWGVGMSDKTIKTALCPGGKVRMQNLMRLIQNGRIDPTRMTSHRFAFKDIDQAFVMMRDKSAGIIKPLISFA